MPNPVSAQSVIDFDGIRKQVAETRSDVADWINESKRLLDELKASSTSTATELGKLRSNLSGNIESGSITQYGQRVETLTRSFDDQKKAIEGLKSTEEQVSAVQKTLSARTEELLNAYAALNGTSAKVVSEKKRIAAELTQLTGQYDKLGKVVNGTKSTLKEAGDTYSSLNSKLSDWRKELKNLDGAFDANTGHLNKNNKAAVDLMQNIQRGDAAIKKMDAGMGQFNRNVGNYPTAMGGFTASLAGMVTGMFTLQAAMSAAHAIVDFGKEVFDITAKFEKYNAILATTLGSTEAGAAAFAMIQEFAAKTNFGVDELTDSYIKLANRGLRPGQEELMKLADVANATGKPMGSLVEAINDINNTERWNEFGIKAKTNGDKVSLTFKGVTKEVARTEAGVMGAIAAFGEMPGVIGMTAKISGTLEGQLSNLGDNFDKLKSTIGGDMKGSFQGLITLANVLIETFIKVWQGTLPIREAFGIVMDTVVDVGKEFWGLIQTMFNLRDSTSATSIIMGGLVGTFKIVATVLVVALSAVQLLVGGFNILLNKGKEVANFFGADFKIDPEATFKNLIDDFTKAGTRVVDIWDDTKKKVGAVTPGKIPDAIPSKPPAAKVDNKKAAAEAEKRLREELAKQKAITKQHLAELETMYKEGKLTEGQFINDRAQMEQDGVFKIQKILKKHGKQKTTDYIETETELLTIAGKLADERTKLEEKAWKEALAAVKDGLKAIESETKGKLAGQIAELDKAFAEGEGDIERRVAKRTITEAKGQDELYDLKADYLAKLAKITEEALAEENRREKEQLDKLKANAKTEVQIKEAAELEKEAIAKTAAEKEKAITDASVKAKEEAEKKKTDAVKREAEQQQQAINASWQLASQAVSSYFELTNSFREKDLESLNIQKEHELELAGDNADAKAAIEKKFDQQTKAIRKKQAASEKASAVFSIIINTAKAVAESLPNIPLAIIMGALGGFQLATVIAKPIPEFYKGKKDNYEGLGIVGDRGFEFIERKDPRTGRSSFEYAAQQQVTYLSKHDRVYTHNESVQMVRQQEQAAQTIRKVSPMPFDRPVYSRSSSLDEAAMERVMNKAFASQPTFKTVIDEDGLRRYTEKQNSINEWKNKHFSYPKKKH